MNYTAMLKNFLAVALAFTLLALLPAGLQARNRHKSGFFLRYNANLGSAEADTDIIEEELSGISLRNSLAIGGILRPYLALHAGFDYIVNSDDENATLADIVLTPLSSDDNHSYRYTVLTAGLTWFFMPINIYISPQIRLPNSGEFSYEVEDRTPTYDISSKGISFGVTIGKEWYSSKNLGLGAALSYTQDNMELDDPKKQSLTNRYLQVGFSLTYN